MAAHVHEGPAAARLRLVEEHIACENSHDLAAIMQTVGMTARYEDVPWLERHSGRDGVERYYIGLLNSIPDLRIDLQCAHVAGDAVVVEVVIRGTHRGEWRGLPPTGRRVEFPLCGIFTFDENERIAGERIYYDRATVLRQLGVFHEPETLLGKILMVANHPVTLARALFARLSRRL